MRKAIHTTRAKRNGDLILKAIDMLYWSGTHNHAGAAVALYVSKETIQRWNQFFEWEVARNFGLMDYTVEARKLKPVKCSLANL